MQPALLNSRPDTEVADRTSSRGESARRPPRNRIGASSIEKGLSLASLPTALVLAGLSVAVRFQLWMQAVIYPYDSYYYMGTAQSLAAGVGYYWRGGPHTRFLPGYPIAVAPFVKMLGPEAAAVTVSAVAWALVGVVCYLTARRLAGWFAGIAAAVMVLFHPVAIEWTMLPMAEGLFLLAAYSSLALMLKALQDRDFTALVLAGASGGYAAITRNEGVALFPIYLVCAAWLLLKSRKDAKSGRVNTRRAGPRSSIKAVAGLVLLSGPFGIWLLWSASKTAPQLSYVSELRANLGSGLSNLLSGAYYYSWPGYRQPFVAALGYLGLVWLLGKSPRAAALLGAWIISMTGIHSLWYYRYDRFSLASVPALAIAGGSLIGALASLGEYERHFHQKFSRGYLLIGLIIALVATGVVLDSEGEDLANLHMSLLNRGGGRAIVEASRIGGKLKGDLASNAGALTEFYAQKHVVDILPQYTADALRHLDPREVPCRRMIACFDPDKVGPGTPQERLEALRSKGVEYLILQIDSAPPTDVVGAIGLPPEAFETKAIVVSGGPSEANETHRAAILKLKSD